MRRRLRRPDGAGRGDRVAAQHPGLARLPAPRPAGRAHGDCRSSSTTTPRPWRWGRGGSAPPAGERDFLAMVVSTGVGGGIVARRPAARRGRGQRRPHRPRDRGARRAAVRLRRTGLPRGRGVGPVDRGAAFGVDPAEAGDDVRRRTGTAGGPGGGVGRQPARPAAGRRWPGRWRWGSATPFFAAAQAELDGPVPDRVRPGGADRPRRAGRRGPAGGGGRGRLAGPRPRRRGGLTDGWFGVRDRVIARWGTPDRPSTGAPPVASAR